MDGAPAHPSPAVVDAEFDRIVAASDPLVGPIQLLLLVLVGGEILERPPKWTGIESDDGKSGFGKLAGERPATGARANNREVHLIRIAIAAHRHPPAFAEHIGRAPVDGA